MFLLFEMFLDYAESDILLSILENTLHGKDQVYINFTLLIHQMWSYYSELILALYQIDAKQTLIASNMNF